MIKIYFMDDGNKLVVFDKKEVFLLFIFMVFVAITCFTIGFRFGRQIGLENQGLTQADQAVVDLKSKKEEEIAAVIDQSSNLEKEELRDQALEQLKDEFNNLDKEDFTDKTKVEADVSKSSELLDSYNLDKPKKETRPAAQGNYFTGKFTIQLGSYDRLDDAKEFADGFTIRGYDPIINEITIEGKGTWFRVSIGLFDSEDQARAYTVKESSLFSGQEGKDYIITKIK